MWICSCPRQTLPSISEFSSKIARTYSYDGIRGVYNCKIYTISNIITSKISESNYINIRAYAKSIWDIVCYRVSTRPRGGSCYCSCTKQIDCVRIWVSISRCPRDTLTGIPIFFSKIARTYSYNWISAVLHCKIDTISNEITIIVCEGNHINIGS